MEMLIKSLPYKPTEGPTQNSVAQFLPSKPRIDFSDHLRVFGLGGALHGDNPRKVARLMREKPLFMADILAAQAVTFYKTELLRERIVENALKCCQDILRDQGFEYFSINEFEQRLENTTSIVIAVGCQNPSLRERRVDATVHVCIPLLEQQHEVVVCFSGVNPGTDTAREPDEASDMERQFEHKIARRELKRFTHHYKLVKENQSKSTADNVRNVAKLLHSEFTNPCSVFLITSSFHAHRLYSEFDQQVLNPRQEPEVASGHEIRHVVVVGAEGFMGDGHPYSSSDVKYLLFEVYRHLLNSEQFYIHLGTRRRRRKTSP